MKLKRLLIRLLCTALIICCILPLAACTGNGGPVTQTTAGCTAHVDADQNGKCDICGNTVTIICNVHIDGNNDGSCDNCGSPVTPVTPGKTRYTVQVKTTAGMPLSGITVYIHNGDGISICAMPLETNAEGIAVFELDTSDQYSVQLDGVPDGYNVKAGDTRENRYPMTATGSSIMLSSAPIKDGGFARTYELGDIMYDFTLTDVDGNSHTLSEMLKEKRMVMLNFWYVDCSWCAKEFPSLNESYKKYSDLVEVLALNDYGDTLTEIKNYPITNQYAGEENNLLFPFFQIKQSDSNLILAKFEPDPNLRGYPTTVIIDRYGVVCLIESGAIVGSSQWDKIFAHFTADDYEQKLVEKAEDLTPPEIPDIPWGGSDAIANAFNGSADLVTEYKPETSEKDALYSWPFIPAAFGENNSITAVQPSNKTDNSYAILYADIQLKPGQAVMFDYFSSCDYGNDNLYVLVDGKDICTLTGVNGGDKTDLADWEQCCAYVDPRPITATNKDDLATYSLSFVYMKDSDTSAGEDTVYLRNLRSVSVDEITTETYIFRYAATDLSSLGDGYDTYVDYVLGKDGYYHVRTADGEEGPLLLANFLGYTNFDSKQTMSQRITGAGQLLVNNEDKYNYWMIYANASSNSKIGGYTPVTSELKEMLDAYCETYRREAGKSAHENIWLQLCIYYDAYGKDADGNDVKPLANPIQGLTTFSAFQIKLEDPQNQPTVECTVTYDSVIMPRGYLYEFVPTLSGVYRFTSKSVSEVTGWIFTGTSHEWADMGEGERKLLVSSEREERLCPELHFTDANGNTVRDMLNVSLVAYMEAGKSYFIDIAYYDIYEEGSFTFETKYVGPAFNAFVMASPGPVTYIESVTGSMGQLIAVGIDYEFVADEDGVKYAYHVIERDENGDVKTLGSKIYADFYYPTIPFPSQSIVAIAALGAFDFSIGELDVDAISYWSQIRSKGKSEIIGKWLAEGKTDAVKLWSNKNMDAILEAVQKGDSVAAYPAEDVATAREALELGILAIKTQWGQDNIGSEQWEELQMDQALRGTLSADAAIRAQQEEHLADIEKLWSKTYQMDDVAMGIYHGTGENMTAAIQAYIEQMDQHPDDAYERQGCVAVTEELAGILSQLFSKYVFEDVEHDWLKFCFYYDQMGAAAAA